MREEGRLCSSWIDLKRNCAVNGHCAQRINHRRTDSASEMGRKVVWQKEQPDAAEQ
jgi:hypothetical protein